jgi:hypothetical protein
MAMAGYSPQGPPTEFGKRLTQSREEREAKEKIDEEQNTAYLNSSNYPRTSRSGLGGRSGVSFSSGNASTYRYSTLAEGRVKPPHMPEEKEELREKKENVTAKKAARSKEIEDRLNDPGWGLTPLKEKELTAQEFQALTPRQRSAVLFNTGLMRATEADEKEKNAGHDEVLGFLASAGVDTAKSPVQDYADLSRLIEDSILKRLGDKKIDQVSTAGSPNRLRRAIADSRTMATSVGDSLRMTGLGPNEKKARLGFGQTPNDIVLRMAYDIMVDSASRQTPEEMAQGLHDTNVANGTNVTTQQLWDFAKLQLDAADFGSIGQKDLTVPVSQDSGIVPMSTKDIRARYGL